MSTIATIGPCSSTAASSSSGVAASATTSMPSPRTNDAMPSRNSRAVVGDHDAHGSSAVTTVPAPGGLRMRSVPSSAATRSARPWSPVPARLVGAADAVVGDLDHRHAVAARDPHRRRRSRGRTWRRWPAPRRRRSTPRAPPARAGAPRLSKETVVGDARARRQRVERGLQPVVEHRGMDAARELAQLLQRLRELVAGRVQRAASASAGSLRMRLWIIRSWSATDTSRCCAPSWRLRSSRRRSASPAATMRSREARSSASRSCGLRLQARVVERDRRRGRDGADELRIVVERRVVDEHRELAPVALDRRRDTVAAGSRAARPAVRGRRCRSARPAPGTPGRGSGSPSTLASPASSRAPRSVLELAEEVREAAAREPGAQQAPEQRGRDGEQRRVQDRHEQHRRASRAMRLVRSGGVQHAGQAARRGSAAALAGAGATPTRQRVRDHDRDGERRDAKSSNWTLSSALAMPASGHTSSRLSGWSAGTAAPRTAGRRGRRRTSDERRRRSSSTSRPPVTKLRISAAKSDDPQLADQQRERERDRRRRAAPGSGR